MSLAGGPGRILIRVWQLAVHGGPSLIYPWAYSQHSSYHLLVGLIKRQIAPIKAPLWNTNRSDGAS